MQSVGSGVKTIGAREVIHGHTGKMFISVCNFIKKNADSGKVIKVNQIKNHISKATDVFLSSLKCIVKDCEHNERVGKELGTTHHKRTRRKTETYR
jgi:hypothetical protein